MLPQKERPMLDNATNPDLKTLMARNEMIRFMDQINAISSIPLSVIDSDGAVAYESASTEDTQRNTTELADDDYRFPIKINDVQIGTIVAYKSDNIEKNRLMELVESIGQMFTERLVHELDIDDFASGLIHSYQELNMLYELSTPLASVLDVKQICHIVLKQAVEIIESQRAFMMLVDSENEQLVVTASVDATRDLRGLRIKIENSLYEGVIQNGDPLVIGDLEKYPHLRDKINGADGLHTIPFICVPVTIERIVSGVISMSRRPSGKPYTSEDTKLLCAMASQAGISLGNARLYRDLREMFVSTVEALAAAVEAKDPYTYGHCQRVAKYSVAIGEDIELPGKEKLDLKLAGILHDVGKVGISGSILRKSAELTQMELAEIRSHPVKGAEIVKHVEQMSDIALWIRHHHERYNGTGYPDGLQGEQIPLHSRILAVADAYDCITSNRNGTLKYPHDTAVTRLQTGSGSEFDPEIINVFLNLVREDIYEQYLEAYQNDEHPQTPRLNRLAYYRMDSEISSLLAREALENHLSDSERERLHELRELVLRC